MMTAQPDCEPFSRASKNAVYNLLCDYPSHLKIVHRSLLLTKNEEKICQNDYAEWVMNQYDASRVSLSNDMDVIIKRINSATIGELDLNYDQALDWIESALEWEEQNQYASHNLFYTMYIERSTRFFYNIFCCWRKRSDYQTFSSV
jgi:hypothetical protein